jgi:hypothetical protein
MEAEVQRALARAQPEIDRAIPEAQVHRAGIEVQERIDRAMHRAQVRIEMRARDRNVSHGRQDDEAPNVN